MLAPPSKFSASSISQRGALRGSRRTSHSSSGKSRCTGRPGEFVGDLHALLLPADELELSGSRFTSASMRAAALRTPPIRLRLYEGQMNMCEVPGSIWKRFVKGSIRQKHRPPAKSPRHARTSFFFFFVAEEEEEAQSDFRRPPASCTLALGRCFVTVVCRRRQRRCCWACPVGLSRPRHPST